MAKDYSDVEIYLADPQTNIRREIAVGMHRYGVQNITEFKRFDDLVEALESQTFPDLLIIDAEMPGADTAKFLKALRHNQYGGNPYLPIVATAWHPEKGQVRALAFAGVDSIVTKPLSPAMIMEKIDAIARNRKPFVVTSDYVGPDRRKDEQRSKAAGSKNDLRMIDVPNSLQMKMDGSYNGGALEAAINAANGDINNGKLEGHARTVAMLVRIVIPALRGEEDWDEKIEAQTARLLAISKDIARRLNRSDFAHISDLCKQLHRLIKNLCDSDDLPTDKDLSLLEKLSLALLKATRPEAAESDLVSSISSSVATWQRHRAQ